MRHRTCYVPFEARVLSLIPTANASARGWTVIDDEGECEDERGEEVQAVSIHY